MDRYKHRYIYVFRRLCHFCVFVIPYHTSWRPLSAQAWKCHRLHQLKICKLKKGAVFTHVYSVLIELNVFLHFKKHLALKATNSSNSSSPDLWKSRRQRRQGYYFLSWSCLDLLLTMTLFSMMILSGLACLRQGLSQSKPAHLCSWRSPSCSR